jgi:hypothetical protein
MATMPGEHRRTLSNRELIALAGFSVCGAVLAFVHAFGVLA